MTNEMKCLDAAMDNTFAWKIGEVCNQAVNSVAGDYVDRGLILTRLLREKGFGIVLVSPLAPPAAPARADEPQMSRLHVGRVKDMLAAPPSASPAEAEPEIDPVELAPPGTPCSRCGGTEGGIDNCGYGKVNYAHVDEGMCLIVTRRDLSTLRGQIEGMRELMQEVATRISPWNGVTAGANPRIDGTMGPPLWHCRCEWCGANTSVAQWKMPEHPPTSPISIDCPYVRLVNATFPAEKRTE